MKHPEIILIAAVARNRAIGLDNQLLWRLPDDLKRFKALTLGHPILMGRKTFESLGRPLPGRRNLVVSRNLDWRADGTEGFTSLEAAIAACADVDKIYVIGGAEIYTQALPLADALALTEVDDIPIGDVFFPYFDRTDWQETARQNCVDANSGLHYDFANYQRKHPR